MNEELLDQEENEETLDQEEYEDIELEENAETDTIDYTSYFEDITEHLETIETNQVVISEQLQVISDNSNRLYYFVGGLYVAFAIVLAIRFLKIFF